MLSPLQLQEHKILRIYFDTKKIEEEAAPLSFRHALTVHKKDEPEGQWLARLDLQFSPENEGETTAYFGEIAVVGVFHLDSDYPSDKASDMVHMNAGAILFGIVRELLSSISARGVHGPIVLPTVDARCFLPKPNEKPSAP
jgi:preprotein translocase subunit SecB